MKRLLELFCGENKSVSKWGESNGYEVVTLDWNPKCHPTICENLLTWDYRVYPPGHFTICWASPDCTHFSIARTTGPPRNLEGANALVQRTLEIFQYFQPKVFCLETPATGLLPKQPYMSAYGYVICDYCMFSGDGAERLGPETFWYRKRTQIYTNKTDVLLKPNVLCDKKCPGILANTKHPGCHAVGFGGRLARCMVSNIAVNHKHRIPQKLVEYLLS